MNSIYLDWNKNTNINDFTIKFQINVNDERYIGQYSEKGVKNNLGNVKNNILRNNNKINGFQGVTLVEIKESGKSSWIIKVDLVTGEEATFRRGNLDNGIHDDYIDDYYFIKLWSRKSVGNEKDYHEKFNSDPNIYANQYPSYTNNIIHQQIMEDETVLYELLNEPLKKIFHMK